MSNMVLDQIKLNFSFTQIYNSYDVNKINRLKESVLSKNPLLKILLKSRNELWLKKFMKAQEKYDNIFLAADVSYFVGTHNMLDMLKEQGFSVSRMTCSQNNKNNNFLNPRKSQQIKI